MERNASTRLLWLLAAFALAAPGYGDDAPTVPITWSKVTPSDADRAMVERVVKKLVAVAQPVGEWAWPPSIVVDDSTELNAYSSLEKGPGDKPQPTVTIHRGWMDRVVQGQEIRFAEVLGHELGHIVLRHLGKGTIGTPLVADAISREHELAADAQGLELMLKAGYSYADYIQARKPEHKLLGDYASFEGLNADHPSDAERVAYLARDDVQRKLWESTSAFENGVYLLTSEQYALAERCFRQVTRDFPSCYEGWANLGYARLMLYCDGLTPENLSMLDVGQFVVGGFYRRAEGLVDGVRGMDERVWFDAVGALREALRIKPDLILAKANLAVAYLVRPAGKDVGAAAELFDQVVQALRKGEPAEPLDPVTTVSLLVNAGVGELSAGHTASSQQFFDQATAALAKIVPGGATPAGDPLSLAIAYNRAVSLAASSEQTHRQTAVKELESYLRAASNSQTWWTLAYDRYAKLCQGLGQPAVPREKLGAGASEKLRLVSELPLPGGITIHLTDALADVVSQLGNGAAVPIVRNTNLQRIRYADRGLDLVATDQVLALSIYGPHAPVLPIRGRGPAAETVTLRIGMPEKELNALLRVEANFSEPRPLTNPSVNYTFYRRLGVGVRLDEGAVAEIVIAQLPAANETYRLGRTAPSGPSPRPAAE